MNLNKYLILFSIVFVLLISISSVSAEGNFTELQEDIDSSGDVLEINQDYTYNNVSDSSFSERGVLVNKSNYVVNGNNHTVDGKYSSKIFNITGSNITINNLNFINVDGFTNAIFVGDSNNILFNNCAFTNVSGYGVEVSSSNVTLNNISYDCNNSEGLCEVDESNIYLSNSNFNYLNNISHFALILSNSSFYLNNSNFTNIKNSNLCLADESKVFIINSLFNNLSSDYASIVSWSSGIFVEDSKFLNTFAGLTGGVIISKYSEKLNVKNCEFIHCFSTKNGGAILADWVDNIAILNSSFVDCFSKFGGGLLVLSSDLVVNNSLFKNNKVEFDGAAIYTSHTNISISNSSFENNSCILDKELDSTNGGALYIDKAKKIKINKSKFINNKANKGGALFIYDSNNVNIANSYFKNNKEAIYGVFTTKYILKNNTWNKDSLSLNNTFYLNVIDVDGVKYTLLNNNLSTKKLPKSFDLRDYGWVTPVRYQGYKGYCWVFGTCGALESALLKSTGLEFDISENNVGNLMLAYSKLGCANLAEGGEDFISSSYFLAWLGSTDTMFDYYDQYGKVSPILAEFNDFHLQNTIFIDYNNFKDSNKLKEALMKYGALSTHFFYNDDYYNDETAAFYCYNESRANHAVTLVGWDDNFSRYNFVNTPPGDGAWIIKNSWGTDFGKDGYMYISYYDTSFLSESFAIGYIISDTPIYNKNYQWDISDALEFKHKSKITYGNRFTATGDDLIAAVGTYFDKSGVDYTINVYVNDKLCYTQKGVSEYFGYATIPLNKYIKVSKGDSFFTTITSNAVPLSVFSRAHLDKNSSLVFYNGKWFDLSTDNSFTREFPMNVIACLKVYTLDCDGFILSAPNLIVKHKQDKYLNISLTTLDGVPVVNANIKVLIKGKYRNYIFNVVTDENGIAHVSLKNLPVGHYSVEFYFKYADKYGDYQLCMNHSSLIVEPADINKGIPMEHTGIPILVLLITLIAFPFSLRRK